MDSEEYIKGLVARSRAAQAIYESFDQQQVDAIVRATGKVIFDNAELLATKAVEETHYGTVAHKTIKKRNVMVGTWAYLKHEKSVGCIEDDPIRRVKVFAKPMGVVCCVTPSTNPVSTVGSNGMAALKARNSMIVSPHPAAKETTKLTVDLIRGELKRLGAPEDLMLTIEEPSVALSKMLMSMADVTIATGGPAMCKAAYSSGKPALAVGQGNTQVILDRTYTDYDTVAQTVINSRIHDLGVPCAGEQTVHIPREKLDEVVAAFAKYGAYIVTDEKDIQTIRERTFVNNAMNRDIVGVEAQKLGEYFGLNVPKVTKVIMYKVFASGTEDVLCREILCVVLRYNIYDTYEEAVDHAVRNYKVEGAGHTCVLWSNTEENIQYAASRVPVCRVVVNMAAHGTAGNNSYSGLVPTMTLGCGTWGGSSVSDNVNYLNLINKTRLAYKLDAKPYDPDEVWGNKPAQTQRTHTLDVRK